MTQGGEGDAGWQNKGAALKFAGEGGAGTSAMELEPATKVASRGVSSKRATRGMEGSMVEPAPGEATAALMPRASSHWCMTLSAMREGLGGDGGANKVAGK